MYNISMFRIIPSLASNNNIEVTQAIIVLYTPHEKARAPFVVFNAAHDT